MNKIKKYIIRQRQTLINQIAKFRLLSKIFRVSLQTQPYSPKCLGEEVSLFKKFTLKLRFLRKIPTFFKYVFFKLAKVIFYFLSFSYKYLKIAWLKVSVWLNPKFVKVVERCPERIKKPIRKVVTRTWVPLIAKFDVIKQTVVEVITTSKEGYLSWQVLFNLSSRNLLNSPSRSAVTVGAIAAGTAAIVFLVGFAYGLQQIVTSRLIQPNSLKLTDVQTSSTSLELNSEALTSIGEMSGVEVTAPAISVAGSLKFNQSKTEVVVVGARNSFLEFSNLTLIDGELFSQEAELVYHGETPDYEELTGLTDEDILQQGEVAGVSIEEKIVWGDPITDKEISYRVTDGRYIPLRSAPSTKAQVVGYVRGSVVHNWQGKEVWGSSYETSGTQGRAALNQLGEWTGRWIQTSKLPVYEKAEETIYIPKNNDAGEQVSEEGFLAQSGVVILSVNDVVVEKMVDSVSDEEIKQSEREQGQVLGISTDESATDSAEATSSAETVTSGSENLAIVLQSNDATASAEAETLEDLVNSQNIKQEESKMSSAFVDVPRKGGKEILISSAVLKLLELSARDVIGKNVDLNLIVSGGSIPGLNGRVLSNVISYTVVGVFKDDKNMVVYTPLSDLESMGITKYSLVKVLASDPTMLAGVRERVEALGFVTRSLADTLGQVDRLFAIMKFLLGGFGMIAFIVAIFGMFNTLTVSLLERTREIGVMKTIGTSDGDVVRLMLVESLIIGICGGFAGIILGIILGNGIDTFAKVFHPKTAANLFYFPFGFLLLVFLISVGVGVLTGFYPANRAKKIEALDALRYE